MVHAPRTDAQTTLTALFALFDCTDDPEAAQALLDVASSWARARGFARIVGPVDLADLPELGVSTDVSVRFLHVNGFAQAGPVTRYLIDPNAAHPPDISPAAQAILNDPDFSFAPQSAALHPQRLSEALAVLHAAIGQVAPFVPPLQVRGVPRTDAALCIVLHHKGRPVGCCLGLPDKSSVWPRTALARNWPVLGQLARFGRTSPPAVTILSGVLPRFDNLAIGSLLWRKVMLALSAGGYATASTHCTANLHGLDTTQSGVTVLARLQLFSRAV